MSLTLTLSGPANNRDKARAALAAAGLTIAAEDLGHHGIPDQTVESELIRPRDEKIGWITGQGEEGHVHELGARSGSHPIDKLGWELRAYHDTPLPQVPYTDPFVELRQRVSELETRLEAKTG